MQSPFVVNLFMWLTITVAQAEAKAAAAAEAAAEAKAASKAKAAAILKDNSKVCTMYLSGVEGINAHINGCYLATQERGQDGRTLYRKMGDDPWCIEHFEGEWQVKAESDRGSCSCVASVEGGCALEDCGCRRWRVMSGKEFVVEPNVKAMTIKEAQRKASGHSIIAPKCSRPL